MIFKPELPPRFGYVEDVKPDGTHYYKSVIQTPEPSIEDLKLEKIKESKSLLSDFLSSHPIQWSDGNFYSVTQEKQSLLTSQLVLYQGAVASGIPYQLSWNSTGGLCTNWTYENLAALAFAIAQYVHPLVSYQQSIEVAINQCTMKEEIENITIDFESVLESQSQVEETNDTEPAEEDITNE